MNNLKDDNKFIDKVIIPYYSGLNKRGGKFTIRSKNNRTIIASDSYVQFHGYKNQSEIIQKSFNQYYPYHNKYPTLSNEIRLIHESVMEKKVGVEYLCAMESVAGYDIDIVYQEPVFNYDGEVIGDVSTFTKLQDYLSKKSVEKFKLNKHQAEILFLLTVGASQKEIAGVFNITRGTIAKEISRICAKLNLNGSSERILSQMANEKGCALVPTRLFKPGSIVPISKIGENTHILNFF